MLRAMSSPRGTSGNELRRASVPKRTNRSKRPESDAAAEPRTDRRIARTQRALHRALIDLIMEKGFSAITIDDIVRRADVGRSTLYAHYGSKEGVLVAGLNILREQLLDAQRAVPAQSGGAVRLIGFSGAFFAHVHEHRELYRALVRDASEATVMHGLKRLLADIVKAELSASTPRPIETAIPLTALVAFVTDAFVSVTLWWVDRNPRVPAAEVDGIFRQLTLPALRTAGYGAG